MVSFAPAGDERKKTVALEAVLAILRRVSFRSLVVLSALVTLLASSAHAEREHRVRAGQNVARIARRYHVAARDIEAANHLRPNEHVRPGQMLVIPDDHVIFVRSGQTLGGIARRHRVTREELAAANRLRPTATLRIGQRLVLPGSPEAAGSSSRWGRPRRPGLVTFYRLATHQQQRIQLLDRRGRVSRQTLAQLARLFAPRGSRATKEPHQRLVKLLARISDNFGGRTIDIVSGYRLPGGFTGRESRHTEGHAVDIRVRGVPNNILRDYCRTLDHVGVGFYPNSYFVHLDVRQESSYWVDLSRPGEAPSYVRPGEEERAPRREVVDADAPIEGEQDVPAASDDGQAPTEE